MYLLSYIYVCVLVCMYIYTCLYLHEILWGCFGNPFVKFFISIDLNMLIDFTLLFHFSFEIHKPYRMLSTFDDICDRFSFPIKRNYNDHRKNHSILLLLLLCFIKITVSTSKCYIYAYKLNPRATT